MSEARRANRLMHETSPYLRQHAHNPVDWYPWGEEALSRSKELDRPIFLSIGYSSCHWCHVMERESFEDEEIARLMNELFINIKVDREERPDLDSVYMTAVQLLTGSGGWPMSVFLTPDLRPFWGGTYFPPRARPGIPGFKDVLREISRVYREQQDKVEETASTLLEHLTSSDEQVADDIPGESAIQSAVDHASRTFDSQYGGFGAAPKFPRSIDVSMLLRVYSRSGDGKVLEMCERTLDAMALGGMYDQIGGGFHRYSTDRTWLVPHFEKMLYDNALLARTYVEAFQLTKKPLYERIAREILDYVQREMTGPEGGFYSATDADSEGEEGRFFVWTPEQVEAVLGKEDARLVCDHFNITVGGNFENSTSIPHVTRPLEQTATSLRVEPEEAARIVAEGRLKLYAAREERPKPFRDDKLLTSWNGLMISAFARGAQVLDEPRYREAGERAARLILEELVRDGNLLRVRMEGESKIGGFLDDHAFFVEALLHLYETTFDLVYLQQAHRFTEAMIEMFLDEKNGGFYFAPAEQQSLIVRRKDPFDNATPAGNGVAALNLLRLAVLGGRDEYRERAEQLLRGVKNTVERAPMAFSSTLMALDFFLYPPAEVVVVGEREAPETAALLRAVHGEFLPAYVLAGSERPLTDAQAKEVPLLAGKDLLDGKPTAFVCRNFACRAPLSDPDALREELRRAAGRQ